MRNLGSVTALTVACVLMASGAAAALNDRVLHGGDSPVGTAESFLPADEPWTAPLSVVNGSTPGTLPEEGLEPVGEPSGHASGHASGETGATGAAASASESESEDPVESAQPNEASSSRAPTQSRASANVGSSTSTSTGSGGHDDPTSASDMHDSTGSSSLDPAPTQRDD